MTFDDASVTVPVDIATFDDASVTVLSDIVTFHDASLTVLADIVTFDDAPVTVKAEEDKVDLKSTRLALYIVLPIFLFCFGGSAIGYCLNRIYRNCKYVTCTC